MSISNFTDNFTSSSYNIQQKGRYYTFNSSKNELYAMPCPKIKEYQLPEA